MDTLANILADMILIRRPTIGEAHEEVVRIIAERCEGTTRMTEDGEVTYDPEEPICIHIESPFSSPMKSSASLFGDRFSDQYQSSLYTITRRKNDGTDATYTYGNRLRDYPVASLAMNAPDRSFIKKGLDGLMKRCGYVPAKSAGTIEYSGDGNLGGIDQIQTSIIDRLIENPSSRRAVAITWSPFFDITRDEPPCLQIVQCVIDKSDHLNLICLFRSNDMLSAWGQNAYGLAHMQKFILDSINDSRQKRKKNLLTQGWIETISISAHMYITRDQLELMKFLKKEQTKESFKSFHKT
ncbi:MAG: thymidylate synthase [Methanospirillum sp.]|uniref:thymidylate synthase n=1 Tax=Methanospirillum sp. TaxID=45200 RepID=UPI00236C47BD|nr:thymidylate synthase [Methanospirillum sp.]MDD1727809.1 thymidylate synthase [Methanospirillum sp.]